MEAKMRHKNSKKNICVHINTYIHMFLLCLLTYVHTNNRLRQQIRQTDQS